MAQQTSLFVARDSSIHRLNPLTKLTITGFLLVCGLALPGFWTNYLLFLLLIIPLAAMAGVLKAITGNQLEDCFAVCNFCIFNPGFLMAARHASFTNWAVILEGGRIGFCRCQHWQDNINHQ